MAGVVEDALHGRPDASNVDCMASSLGPTTYDRHTVSRYRNARLAFIPGTSLVSEVFVMLEIDSQRGVI